MAFLFEDQIDADWLDFGGVGANATLFQTADISIGAWIRVNNAAVASGTPDVFFRKENGFFGLECIRWVLADGGTNGLGVLVGHVRGGGALEGVTCIPGAVSSSKFTRNQWMYFGISRKDTVYLSYFGNQRVMLDGPVHDFSGAGPAGINGGGLFSLGHQFSNGEYIGPFSYWKRALTKAEHQLMASCTLPANHTDLLIWSKMFPPPDGPLDLSSYSWVVNTHGPDALPQSLKDNGCASFGAGLDYSLTNT